jgi:phage baseplate assembly protein W
MVFIPRNRLFVGYSTVATSSKVQQFADIELIKRDLLNHFYTRKGERVMMPTYGCAIWDLLFEQFNEEVKDSILEECTNVIAADSRVRLMNITVKSFDQGFMVQMDLLYVPYDVVDTFSLQFDNRMMQSA